MSSFAAGASAPPAPLSMAMFGATMVLGLVMFIYGIALVVFQCLPGARGSNRFPTIRVALTSSKFSPDLPHSGRDE